MTAIDLPRAPQVALDDLDLGLADLGSSRYRRALIWLLLAIFAGWLSLVAVQSMMRVECRYIFMTVGGSIATGGGALLTAGTECRLNDGRWISVPKWAQAIIPALPEVR